MVIAGPASTSLETGADTAWAWVVPVLVVALAALATVVAILARRLASACSDARRRERALADAERATLAAKDRLTEVSSMTGGLAHEIKNPLSTLVLNAQLLDEELEEHVADDESRRRLRRRVEGLVRETVRLRGILEDFLRYAGRMRLDPQRRDVVALVSDLVDFFHPQCDQSAVVLRTELPDGSIELEVDEAHLKQAVLNLMLNAVQAMDGRAEPSSGTKGELIVRLEGDDAEVRIHVIDTGPGIPRERIEEVFRPYVSGKPGGSGLGLPTARRIVEEHRGRLTVHSDPGHGSDFVIHLPRSGHRSTAAAPPPRWV